MSAAGAGPVLGGWAGPAANDGAAEAVDGRPPLGAGVRVTEGRWIGRVGRVAKHPGMFREYVYVRLEPAGRAKGRVEFVAVAHLEAAP